MTVLAVELSDLKGYADLVARAAADCTAMGARSLVDIPDGDFGRILELVTLDYEALLPSFHEVLGEDGRRLDRVAATVRAIGGDFAETDHAVALSFGSRCPMRCVAASHLYGDLDPVRLPQLDPVHVDLPLVRFGAPLDQICWLAVRIGLPDLRELTLRWLVGDLTKASTQAAYWDLYADEVSHVRANLAHGAALIRDSWEGRAAEKADAAVAEWLAALADQSRAMSDLGDHLHGMIAQAIEMARTVIDLVRCFVSTMTAAWANAYLPGLGEIRLVRKIREAWHLISNAQRVLSMFWSALRVFADVLRMAVDGFAVTHLPAAPALPARHAA